MDHVDETDLSGRLQKLFKDFNPPIHISDEDFAIITNNGSLLNERGQLGFPEFETAMKFQIKLYVQRQLSNTLVAGAGSGFEVLFRLLNYLL